MRCRIHADTAHRNEQYTHHTEVYRTHRYIEHSEIDTIEETTERKKKYITGYIQSVERSEECRAE